MTLKQLLARLHCELQSHNWQLESEPTWAGVTRESIRCGRCGAARPNSTRPTRRTP